MSEEYTGPTEHRATEYGVNDIAPFQVGSPEFEQRLKLYADGEAEEMGVSPIDDGDDDDDYDEWNKRMQALEKQCAANGAMLSQTDSRITELNKRVEDLAEGINKIGEMLNFITQTVAGVAQQFQSGGLTGLMGMLGGKNDG